MELSEARSILTAASGAWSSTRIALLEFERTLPTDIDEATGRRYDVMRDEERLRAEVLDACVIQYAKAIVDHQDLEIPEGPPMTAANRLRDSLVEAGRRGSHLKVVREEWTPLNPAMLDMYSNDELSGHPNYRLIDGRWHYRSDQGGEAS